MKKYIVLAIFALIAHVSFGQNKYQEVVYLKDGSIIRGIIIEQVPNKSLKIETVGKNVFAYEMNEIEKITKEPIRGKRTAQDGSIKRSGYKGIVEAGYQIGVGDNGVDRMKLDFINSYQFNPYFSLGVGTGLRYYFDSDATIIPLYADFRANIMDRDIAPYVSLGVGYSFNSTNSFEGVGLLLSPTAGVNIKISDKSAVNVGLSYEMQKVDIYDDWDYYYSSNVNSGALSIIVGISF
ncbi:hypothetical protein [Labilibacter marinus]|uniref:hypothetical protein n=1 Tax=Labilibacter marinus TaxID=1477105 RepID=UPI0008298308|nr:hypothetical protein [Labilibacter marinus]